MLPEFTTSTTSTVVDSSEDEIVGNSVVVLAAPAELGQQNQKANSTSVVWKRAH